MGFDLGVVTTADIKLFAAIYFAGFAVLVVFVGLAQRRFYRAYLARYADSKEGRRWSRFFPLSLRDMFRPPRRLRSWFQSLDDPLVDRRRREHLLAWGGLALWFAFPLVLVLYGSLVRD